MYMKKLFFAMLLAAMSIAGLAQRMDYVDVTNHPDGRYSDESSNIVVTGFVLDGKKTGTWIECHSNTELPHFIAQYADGKLEGIYLEIDKQGCLLSQMEYKNGLPDGTSLKWAKGGRLSEMVSYKNGLKDGPVKLCYEKGTVKEESSYKNGQRDGVTIWYAYMEKEQGPKMALYTYKDGVFDGLQETYYDNGAIKTRKMFKDNVQVGAATEFYEDGSVKSETVYKNGAVSGKIKEYPKGKKSPK